MKKNILLLFLLLCLVLHKDVYAAITTSPQPTFRTNGMLLLDGNSFFPFGFYHVTDSAVPRFDMLADDIQKMGQAGFNIVVPTVTWLNGTEDTALARSKARELNMYIFGTYYRPSITTWITETKNEPNFIGWNTFDDLNAPVSSPRYTPTDIRTYNSTIKTTSLSVARTTLTYGAALGYPYQPSSNLPYYLRDYKATMDIIGIEAYPISNTDPAFGNNPLEESITYYSYARAQLGPNQSIWALPQTFAWPGGRYPTDKEIRNMVYGGLIKGMNGIVAYTYYDDGGVLPERSPTVWTEITKLRQDIKDQFLNAITDGQLTTFDSQNGSIGPARIHAGWWLYNNKFYIVVVNTNQTQALTTNIQLPSSVTGILTPVFTDTRYPNTLQLDAISKRLTGTVPSQAVEVYTANSQLSTKVGDANNDLRVDGIDYVVWLQYYNTTTTLGPAHGDFNSSGKSDGVDYVVWLQNYGK